MLEMTYRGLLLGLVACTAGCDRVFEFNEHSAPMTCSAPLAPDGDEDHDSILNGVDACALVPNQEDHDEDLDGALDACDLCPHLDPDGEDLDCDGLGAACDPDETVAHVQQFFGFGTGLGLDLDSAVIENDVLRAPIDSTAQIAGSARVKGRVPAAGTYELTGRFLRTTHPPTNDFGYIALRFDPSLSNQYLARISGGESGGPYGNFQIQLNDQTIATMPIGPLPTDGAFTLRVTISATEISASITGFTTATISTPLPAPLGDLEYWIESYHDVGSDFVAELAYLRRVALAPLAP